MVTENYFKIFVSYEYKNKLDISFNQFITIRKVLAMLGFIDGVGRYATLWDYLAAKKTLQEYDIPFTTNT